MSDFDEDAIVMVTDGLHAILQSGWKLWFVEGKLKMDVRRCLAEY